MCLPFIGTIWEPGTEPPLPLHPHCYCAYFPTDRTPAQGRPLPDVDSLPPNVRAAWIRYTAWLLRLGIVLVPFLLQFEEEARQS